MHDPVSFGRYIVSSLLGTGGMARVFRGHLPGPMGFEKPVALKIVGGTADDAGLLGSLTNEARLGGQIHHPNVVEIYEFGVTDGLWFVALEFVDGWTLAEVVAACDDQGISVPPRAAIDILTEVSCGLAHAHDLKTKAGEPLKLVHRDLKPGNVMVSRSGEVKILDFGVAKATTTLFQTTATGALKGTPRYMSPEQAAGEPLDQRSDLFSFGSLMAEPALSAATGWVDFNSVPWSSVTVDGQDRGVVPVLGLELTVGEHVVVFDCRVCEPVKRRELTLQIEEGQRTKHVVDFASGP